MDLLSATEVIETAFVTADDDRLLEQLAWLQTSMPCVKEPIPASIAASLHRIIGLQGFVDRDMPQLRAAFAAARILEPSYQFSMLPPMHPVVTYFKESPTEPGRLQQLSQPYRGYFLFDGERGSARPAERATLVQRATDDGVIQQTVYLLPHEPMFNYRMMTGRREWGKRLTVAGGGTTLAAAILLGWGAGIAVAYRNPDNRPVDDAEWDRARRRNNRLVVSGSGLGVVGITATVSGALLWTQ